MRSSSSVYDDPFNFMIEIVDSTGKRIEAVAGANNGIAARKCFDSLQRQYGPNTILCLRNKARVLKNEAGMERLPPR